MYGSNVEYKITNETAISRNINAVIIIHIGKSPTNLQNGQKKIINCVLHSSFLRKLFTENLQFYLPNNFSQR